MSRISVCYTGIGKDGEARERVAEQNMQPKKSFAILRVDYRLHEGLHKSSVDIEYIVQVDKTEYNKMNCGVTDLYYHTEEPKYWLSLVEKYVRCRCKISPTTILHIDRPFHPFL